MNTLTKQGARPPRRSRRLVSTRNNVKSKTQSGEARPDLDFLNRFKGSLHETIVEGDLATLNSGLAFLFAGLRQAKQLYDEGEDGGRVAAFMALGAMWKFVALLNSPRKELLQVPVLKLMDALAALDQNNVLPILKPVTRRGRAPSSHAYASSQGTAAGTVTRLRESGLNPEEAYKLVANELTKLGVRSERGKGTIKANTVRHWCDDVASDVRRFGTAAMMYDSMFTDERLGGFRRCRPPQVGALRSPLCAGTSMRCSTPAKNPASPPI